MSSLPLQTLAVVLEAPGRIAMTSLDLTAPGAADVVVDITSSGISTGTERLLWSGRMPQFPGMGYPLVPGYESVGVVTAAGPASGRTVGDHVFVPGANCYGNVRGLFGGASARVVLPGARTNLIPATLTETGILLALAATAHHAIHPVAATAAAGARSHTPDLIVGHGVLGRLLARLAVLEGAAPTVWETNPARRSGAHGYAVVDPATDFRRDYRSIYDGSGDAGLIDALVQHMAPGGEIVLAGFYATPIAFAFPPAFMREATFRIAAQWQPADLAAVIALAASGALSLDGLVTHRAPAETAPAAYQTAFTDAACLKMVLDWRRPS